MTLQEFITKWNGKGIDFDGAYGDQCMDLMHQYHVEVLGIIDYRTLAAPAAKDVYLQFETRFNHDLFEKIANTPTGVPNPGDIVLWGTGIGPYGHVAVFVSGDANSFKSFDQNWPVDSKCHLQDHNYTGVLGWLRFKTTVDPCKVALEKATSCKNQTRPWKLSVFLILLPVPKSLLPNHSPTVSSFCPAFY